MSETVTVDRQQLLKILVELEDISKEIQQLKNDMKELRK